MIIGEIHGSSMVYRRGRNGDSRQLSHLPTVTQYHTIALISHASKIMLRILQFRLQQYVNSELPHIQAGLEKAAEPESNFQHPLDHQKSKRFKRNVYFYFSEYAKAFDCVDHNKLLKILKRDGNTRPPDLPPEKSVSRSRSNS